MCICAIIIFYYKIIDRQVVKKKCSISSMKKKSKHFKINSILKFSGMHEEIFCKQLFSKDYFGDNNFLMISEKRGKYV